MPNEIDMKIRLSKRLLSEARKAATPSPQGPPSLNPTASDLLRKPIPIPSPIWVRIPIPLVYPRPHFPSLSTSLSLFLSLLHFIPWLVVIICFTRHFWLLLLAMVKASLQATGLYFVLLFLLFTPNFLSIFCLFFCAKSSQMQRFCGSYPVCCDIKLHLRCRLEQFFNANLSCGFVAPLHIDVCVCGGRGKCLCDCNLVHDTRDLCYSIEYYAKCTRFSESDNVNDIE